MIKESIYGKTHLAILPPDLLVEQKRVPLGEGRPRCVELGLDEVRWGHVGHTTSLRRQCESRVGRCAVYETNRCKGKQCNEDGCLSGHSQTRVAVLRWCEERLEALSGPAVFERTRHVPLLLTVVSFFPPTTPSNFPSASMMSPLSSDPRHLAPKGPARPSRPSLRHMDSSPQVEKHFVLPPILYQAATSFIDC
jgi:hypothetical protein